MNDRLQRHLNDDDLINLAGGLIAAGDREGFLAHLRQCRSCEDRFVEVVRDRETLRSGAVPSTGNRPAPRRRVAAAAIAVAAVAAILAFIILLPRQGSLEYWLPTDRAEALLRSDPVPDKDSRFFQALAAYRDHDAAESARLLEASDVPEGYKDLRDLFLASSLLLGGRAREAAEVLDAMDLDTLNQPERRRGQWILYIALRRLGENQRADGLLDELAGGDNDIGERARKEKERIGR